MAKGKVTTKSLRAGQTVYRVSGPSGNIGKHIITSRPFAYKKKCSVLNGTMWVKYRKYFSGKVYGLSDYYEDDFSLTDAGIDGSHRNSNNRSFYSYKAAKRWSDYVKSLPKKIEDDFDLLMDGWRE
ncbi:hypothetical protein HPMBJEAJ_00062 [Aeromonas phage avDM6]|nr:hypothetical protein HPMBJEAJ_00062 [Aeromonas phage avDM6]